MHTEFIIKELGSWAVVEFATSQAKFEFWASKIYPDSFNDLMDALTKIVQDKTACASVYFDLESEGSLHLFFTRYAPMGCGDLLKIEIYKNLNWYKYGDEFEELPMPTPHFACLIIYEAYFAHQVLQEIKRHGKEAFFCFNNNVWVEKVLALEAVIMKDLYFARGQKPI